MPDDLMQGMHELLWALIALGVLGLLIMLGFGKSQNNLMPSGFISFEDVIEGGLFAVAFMILMLPLYPLYALGAVVWHKLHPPMVLDVHGADPLWGRDVNRKVVEEAFRAVQQAWTNKNPSIAKDYIGPDLLADLQRECARLTAQHETTTHQDIQIGDIDIQNERIDDYKMSNGKHIISYYLDAAIHGAMTNVTRRDEDGQITAGLPDPHPFGETMQFARGPGDAGHWLMVTSSGIPHTKDRKPKKDKPDHPSRKSPAHKAEHTTP